MDYRKSLNQMSAEMKNDPVMKRYQKIRSEINLILRTCMEDINNNLEDYEHILLKQQSLMDIDFNNQLDLSVLAELLIYPQIKGEDCLLNLYIQKHFLEAHKDIMLSMLESKFSLYKFISRDSKGRVTLQDLVNDETIEVIDSKFGLGFNSPVYYAGRVITHEGISFLSGADLIFPVNSSTNKYMKKIITDFKYKENHEVVMKLYYYFRSHQKK